MLWRRIIRKEQTSDRVQSTNAVEENNQEGTDK
jgi:hypothetical protein